MTLFDQISKNCTSLLKENWQLHYVKILEYKSVGDPLVLLRSCTVSHQHGPEIRTSVLTSAARTLV